MPLEKGVYAITGKNGCGKSTIMSCLARVVVNYSLKSFLNSAKSDTQVAFNYKGNEKICSIIENKGLHDKLKKDWSTTNESSIKFQGMYEGSFFFGTRFNDSKIVDRLLHNGVIKESDLVPADPFIIEEAGKILQNNISYYTNLMKLSKSNRKLTNKPYFYKYDNLIVSQYNMSSGECLLISLLDFINNTVIKKPGSSSNPILLIIDEIESALHPSAVKRFIEYLTNLTQQHNVVVYISSHSAEVIRQIKPINLFNIDLLSNNSLSVTNPCYPAYAIRDVYVQNEYDYVILVEDFLAKKFVEKCLVNERLKDNKLISVIPVGGAMNVLELHKELQSNNYFGISTKILSILDGDMESEDFHKNYNSLFHIFLPILSIEKYLQAIVKDPVYDKLKKQLDSYVFTIKTMDSLYSDVNCIDSNGKHFYKVIVKHMEERNIKENEFVNNLNDELYKFLNDTHAFTKFVSVLKSKLS